MRLAAALLVLFFHLGYYWSDHPLSFFSSGWIGVEIFFVISGFVIAFSAEGNTVGQFAKSRIARLYPAAFICSTIIVLLRWSYAPSKLAIPDLPAYLRSITLFPIGPWVDGVYWTLPIEMSFYSLVGFALWRKWPLNRLALWLGFYSCLFWCLKAINAALHFVKMPATDSGISALTLLYYGVYFALGMLLYARKHLLPALVFLGFGFVAASAASHDKGGTVFLIAPFVWLFATSAIAASVFWNDRMQWMKTRTAGLMTYPLYLIHTTVGVGILMVLPFPFGMIAGAVASLAVSMAVLPLERAIRRIFRAPRPVQPASLP